MLNFLQGIRFKDPIFSLPIFDTEGPVGVHVDPLLEGPADSNAKVMQRLVVLSALRTDSSNHLVQVD